MQKKIIALAVAGLASGAAMAQSNVTIYGMVDMGVTKAFDSYNDGTKNLFQVQSGAQSSSRVGFKGTEDMGNGMYAAFRHEMGILSDTGVNQHFSGAGFASRWSTVTLGSKTLGEIEAGRRDTFHDQLLGGASANGRTTVAQVSPVYIDQARYSNFVAYLSPVMNGLQLKAGFSTAGNDSSTQEVAPARITSNATSANTAANTNYRLWTVAAHYVNGPLLAGATFERNKLQDRDTRGAGDAVDATYNAGRIWNIAAAYDFGPVRIDGAYGKYKYARDEQPAISETRDERSQWTVGLSVPVGSMGSKFTVTYATAKLDYLAGNLSDERYKMIGLAYFHTLSKRTNLYAAYGRIHQDQDPAYSTNRATLSGQATGYQQAVQFGIRHQF